MAREIVFVFVVTSLLYFTVAVPEAGIKEMSFNKGLQYHGFHKSLFSGANIYISGESSDLSNTSLTVTWTLFSSDCAQAYADYPDDKLVALPVDLLLHDIHAVGSGREVIKVNGPFYLTANIKATASTSPTKKPKTKQDTGTTGNKPLKIRTKLTQVTKAPTNKVAQAPKIPSSLPHGTFAKRVKRAAKIPTESPVHKEDTSPLTSLTKHFPKKKTLRKPPKKKLSTSANSGNVIKGHSQGGRVTTVKKDGNYLLRVHVVQKGAPKHEYKVEITVRIKSDEFGFLSAAEWPLLPFYGVMSLVYLAYGVVWLIVSACQWRELLRIQFWIGGVIALGMLEKAVLFSEYNAVNITGVPAHGLVVFGLVISCIKRTLSRILIIIVSLGFGIVKPRLGAALHRVLAVGLLYFILGVIEGGYREKALKSDVQNKQLVAAIPLSILDAVICWWIFMSLMQTMRTLRIRKNVVKLSLYRHFTNILVFSVIASVAFMIWSIKSYHLNACIKDWKELWIDEAFWHFLFAIVLLAIMVLWRPTANNQRYAFTPLIDVGEDDDDDMTLSDAFNGMKMRNKSDGDVANRGDRYKTKLEDDLRWVEENIPTAGGIDTALPTLLDSDEEVMTTKLEMSKME